MSRIYLVLFWLLSCPYYVSAEEKDPKPETPEEIREGIVFQAVADMMANRDKLLQQYAVVLEGEYSDLDGPTPRVYPLLAIRCVSKKHNYDYCARVDFQPHLQFDEETELAIRNTEEWQEQVTCRGKTKVFRGRKDLEKPYRLIQDGEVAKDVIQGMGLVVPVFDPFDDFIEYCSMVLARYPNPGSVERILLEDSKLVQTEQLLGGRINSSWEMLINDKEQVQMKLVFAEAEQFMPIEVVYKFSDPRDFSHMKLAWREHKGFRLPYRMEYANPVFFSKRVQTDQYAFKLRWLVGDEVPDKVFDFESDPRDPLLSLFGIDYEKDGQQAKKPWKPPTDLYQYDDAKK